MTDLTKAQELTLSGLIIPIIKDIVAPKIAEALKKSGESLNTHNAEANFEKYLSQRYEKFSVIDTLVFPNKQTAFDTLYEPLTVTCEEQKEKRARVKIDGYPKNFLPKYFRIVLEDTAGMGKSTITKKLFRSAVEAKAGIPILIELRQLNKANDILTEIKNQLSPIGKSFSENLILHILEEGGFIFIFDGYDEISNNDKDFVIKNLHDFIQKANNNYFLITSRPENSLSSFGDFQKFRIEPLKKSESHNLIRRYDKYNHKPIAAKLIQALKKNKEGSINEFLSNPLLVSLLFKSFDFKKDIPIKKTQFYRQVYDALFESHDLTKEGYLKRKKYSKLHIDDFERVLRYVGFFTFKENKVEYEVSYILKIIENVQTYLPELSFKASDLLKDLLETVPLFKKEGLNVKWSHKSLQEYFAAKFLWVDAKDKQEQILKKIYSELSAFRFDNLIDLFYELDPQTLESTFLYWLLLDFKDFCRNKYVHLSQIPQDQVKRRLSAEFWHTKITTHVSEETWTDASRVREVTRGKGGVSVTTGYIYMSRPKVTVATRSEENVLRRAVIRFLTMIPNLVSFDWHDTIGGELNVLKPGQTYEMNDSPDAAVNQPEVFDFITRSIGAEYHLDYDKAMEKLQMLETSKSQKTTDEFLNW